MAQDTKILGENIILTGSISSDKAALTTDGAGNISAVGNITSTGTITTTGSISSGAQSGGMSATATLTSNGTVTSTARVARVTAGSAVTGIFVGTGTQPGQELTILHTGAAASSITFTTAGSASGSSNVATDFVISGLTCSKFVWDATSALWYPVVF